LTELTLSQRTQELPLQHPRAFLLLAALVWWGLYQSLIPASEAIVSALPVDRESHLGGAQRHAGGVPSRDKIEQWLSARSA